MVASTFLSTTTTRSRLTLAAPGREGREGGLFTIEIAEEDRPCDSPSLFSLRLLDLLFAFGVCCLA